MARTVAVVFGGTGFLGRAVVRRLAAGGWSVRVASRHGDLGAGVEAGTSLVPVRADLLDDRAVASALSGARAAVNAVGLYHPHGGCSFQAIHVEGAARLASAARVQGLESLVHISGIGADPSSPSAYVAARGLGEAAVCGAFPAAVILRPSAIFAAQGSFLDGMIKALAAAPVFPLFGRGETRLQPVYRDDVAEAVVRVLNQPGDRPPHYELGGPQVLTYRELVRALSAHLSRRPMLLPIPFALWSILALVSAPLPRPPLTEGMVALMRRDNVADPGSPGLQDLGIDPIGLSAVLDGLNEVPRSVNSENLR